MSQRKTLWTTKKDEDYDLYLVVKGDSDIALGIVYSTRERAQIEADKLNENDTATA